jgi:hypothetical protein
LALVLFSFLFGTPLTAAVVAAVAAAIPIVIHLLNRNRYQVVTWAAMRFLLAAQRKSTRRLRLEHVLLLAVRTAIVLLLTGAMVSVMPWTEPLWQRLFPGRSVLTATANRRTHKILVIDASFSMAARKAGAESCFDRARAEAIRILHDAPTGDGFSVVLMAAPPRRIVSDPSDEARKVADEVRTLRLPHGNADLAGTLLAVEDMVRKSPAKYQEREVYFLTDLQRSTWTARQSVDPASSVRKIQERARTVFVDVGQDSVNNVAVTKLILGVPLATTGAATPVTATIHNYGREPHRQKRVSLWVGKARSQAADPPLELRIQHQQLIDLDPSQSVTVTFPHRFATPGHYALQVRLEHDRPGDDALSLDDVRTVVVSVKDTVPVMLVNGKPAAVVYDRATEWLKDALNPFAAEQAPRHVAARPRVLSEAQFSDAGLGSLVPYDCVFLCDVARLTATEVHRLETHLQRGGGVVFCLGPQVDPEAYNRLLYRNGEGLLPARLVGRQRAPEGRTFSLFAEEEDYGRPPLDAFAGDKEKMSLGLARFRQYVRVELPPGAKARKILSFVPSAVLPSRLPPASRESRPGESAADLPVGDPALVSWSRFRGQVVLLTTTVNMDWTSWPISPSFPAFVQELLHFAVAGRLREQAALVGDSLEELLPPGSTGLDVRLHTPEGRSEETRTQEREESSVLRWTDTDISGLYRATISKHPQEYLFAVNVPTAIDSQQGCESELTRADPEDLHAAFPGWDFHLVTDAAKANHFRGLEPPAANSDAVVSGIGADAARYLLLVMLALLLTEGFLAWRFGHHSTASVADQPPTSGWVVPTLMFASAGACFLTLTWVLVHAAWTGDFLGFLPEGARRAVESEFDIPPPTPGEGTRWRLAYTPYLRDSATDPWLAATLALAASILVSTAYRKEGRLAGLPYKALLTGLRVGLVLLTLVVLLPQLHLLFERQSWPNVAILIDDSQSMSITDHHQDARLRDAAERLVKVAGLSTSQRLQLAQALLTRATPDWLDVLLIRHQVKVRVYHCSGRATRLADITSGDDRAQHASAVQAIQGLRAEGASSCLGTAVRQVLDDYRGTSLAAVIMLTDGVTTEGDDLMKAAHHASQVGVPLFFVGIGDAHETRDLKLHDLEVEDTVYVNDRVVFEVRLTGQGYTDLTVPVTLHEKGSDKILDTQRVRVDPHGKPTRIRLMHKPTEPGEKVYVVEVPEQPDAIKPADNNQIERSVFVREAKLIKVLYVEGSARYEYRFLKALLERESAQDPRNKTIDLNVLLLDADFEYPKLDKSAVAEFPGKTELSQFDLIILGDLDPADPRVAKHLSDVADFVRERGGGFLMIAGDRYGPQAFKDSPLRDILPIEVVGPEPPDTDRRDGFRPELTAAGRFHPIFRFSPEEAENTAIWNHLAELYWWSEGYQAKPGAEVLAIHPQRKALTARGSQARAAQHPLLVHHFVGAGRAMFFGIDETWRWRFRENELHFNQFWIQTIRYLARSRVGRVVLQLDRQTPYRRGEPIRISVRFPDDAPAPPSDSEVKVLVERRASRRDASPEVEGQSIILAKVEGSRAIFEGLLTSTPIGEYRFWLSSPIVQGLKPRAECRVLMPPGEMDRVQMDRRAMERAAEETHGRFFTLADADNLFQDLPGGTRMTLNTAQPPWSLWNHPVMFLVALFTLTAEWFLRKRKHLL